MSSRVPGADGGRQSPGCAGSGPGTARGPPYGLRVDVRDAIDRAAEAAVVPSFSRVGVALRRRLFDWDDARPPDMTGRVVLVTGATSGLGWSAARSLTRMGATVLALGRDAARVDRAVAGTGAARGYVADMGRLSQVRAVAAGILAGEPRLDVIVHNAGALLPTRTETPEGHEATFASMVLGPFLMTSLLVPRLAETRGRIVWVASGGMYLERLHPDDLELRQEPYRGPRAYARAKRAQVELSQLLAERLRDHGVVSHAMHPGWVDTPGLAEGLPGFRRVMGPLLRDPEAGADTIVWLASSAGAGRSTGRFWLDRRPRTTHRWPGTRATAADRARLWDELVRTTGVDLPDLRGVVS